MPDLEAIAYDSVEFCSQYDGLPPWSASFGLLLLERVPIKPRQTIRDVGAGTGFLSLEPGHWQGRFEPIGSVGAVLHQESLP